MKTTFSVFDIRSSTVARIGELKPISELVGFMRQALHLRSFNGAGILQVAREHRIACFEGKAVPLSDGCQIADKLPGRDVPLLVGVDLGLDGADRLRIRPTTQE